jgi:hypothetical protein
MFSEFGPPLRVSSHHSRLPNAVASSDYRILLPDRLTFTSAHIVYQVPVTWAGGNNPVVVEFLQLLNSACTDPKSSCGIKADPFTFFSNRGHRQRSVLFSPTSGSSDNDLFEIRVCSLLCNRCSCSPLPSVRSTYVIFISMPFKKLYQLLINADPYDQNIQERHIPPHPADAKP